MEGNINGKRQRGRKRKSLLGNIEETTTRRINECYEVALDREEWRRTIASNLWQETEQRYKQPSSTKKSGRKVNFIGISNKDTKTNDNEIQILKLEKKMQKKEKEGDDDDEDDSDDDGDEDLDDDDDDDDCDKHHN
ncbi:hypothetical protein ElyMa_000396700 [Elysia marginata]|uniref:Uncharacterized protein n=1 Tax=Elysia marginata TaxID=1093978 RepID=A0AAV4FIL2_9GAST|nr:hypothetical protein ElyMa_000396700 [Elysia marginata]